MSLESEPVGRGWFRVDGNRPPRLVTGLYVGALLLLLSSGVLALVGGVPNGASSGMTVFHWAIVVSCPVTLALWPWLRWTSQADTGHRIGSVLFALVSVPQLAGGWPSLVVLIVVIMHLALVFGYRQSIAYSVLVAGGAGAITLLHGAPWLSALIEGLVLGLMALWAIAMANVLLAEQRQAERTRRLLAEQVSAHAELRRYAGRVRELTVAEERARMSRDMHDSIGHHLTVIGLQLRNALRYHESGRGDGWDEVRQAQGLTQEALEDTRRWVRALRPLALEGRTGTAAFDVLAQSFATAGLEVRLDAETDLAGVPESVELVLYRVLQEALTNVVRHSGAERVDVNLSQLDGQIRLSVTDNGRGAAQAVAGMGLAGLRQRVDELGGELSSADVPEGGHRLTVSIPDNTEAQLVLSAGER